jgi:protein involved in temperature-dependent protein secretion
MEVWLDEAAAAKVKDSDKRAETIITMLTDGSIRYRPTGFFRRIWFWLFTPF